MSTRTTNPNTTLAFHASRIVIDVGVLLVLGAMSLPFVVTAAENRTAMELDALPALLLVAPIFLMTMLPDQTRPLPRPVSWGALLLGLLAFPYSLLKYLDAVVLSNTLDGSLGLGARMLVFGTFVVVAGIAIGLTRAWMGLASGGHATRTVSAPRRVAPRRQRSKVSAEVAPETREPEPRPVPAPGRQASAPAASAKAASAQAASAQAASAQAASAQAASAQAPEPRPRPAAPAPAPEPRSRPARATSEVSPFGEPLFDSLEIPTSPKGTMPQRQPGLVFGGTGAAERVADTHHEEADPEEPGSHES